MYNQQEKEKVPTDSATIVHQTLKDSERWKRNVVITGLPESADTDDRMQVLEQHLSKKPHIRDRVCEARETSEQPTFAQEAIGSCLLRKCCTACT